MTFNFTETTSEVLNDDTVKCIECGQEKPLKDFQKVFDRRTHPEGEGICKKCWNFCEEE